MRRAVRKQPSSAKQFTKCPERCRIQFIIAASKYVSDVSKPFIGARFRCPVYNKDDLSSGGLARWSTGPWQVGPLKMLLEAFYTLYKN